MKRTLIASALLAAACAGASAQQTKMLTADRHNEYGVVYSLPLTELVVDIEAEQTVRKAGPFYRYAQKYVGTSDVVMEDSESWEIKNVRLYACGVPGGPGKTFLMQVKPGADVSLCLAGEGDGMLLGINKNVDWSPLPEISGAEPSSAKARAEEAVNAYLRFVDEDFLVGQSSATRARMLWETLMTVRESRLSLSRGTAETMPVDGRQLELMLNSLEEQDKAISVAFTGVTTAGTESHRYRFMPDTVAGTDATRSVLGRISDFAGFTDADDLSGDPVYITLEYVTVPELPVDDKGVTKRMPKDGIAYTIPSTARVTLTWRGRTLLTADVDLAQNGVRFGLDPKLFTDKKVPYEAEFDPSTGALLNLGRKGQ